MTTILSSQNLIIFLLFIIILELLFILQIYKSKEKEIKKLSQKFVQYLKPLDEQQELLLQLVDKILNKSSYPELTKLAEKILKKRQVKIPKNFQ